MLDLKDRKITNLCLFVVSFIIIINVILSLNLTFYFANSGNTHLEGYKYAQNSSQNGIIYTHWPFDYSPEGKTYNLGQFSWVTDNRSYKSIKSDTFLPGSALLGSSHFFQTYNFPNVNFYTISSKSLYLDPVLPNVSEKTIDTVSIGIIPNFLVSSSEGWYNPENWSGTPTRWMSGNATLLIYGLKDQSVSLHFQAISFHIPRTLEIYSGNQLASNVSIPTNVIPVNVTIPLKNGENDIRLSVTEGCDRPIDLPGFEGKDSRCLSFAIQNITVI